MHAASHNVVETFQPAYSLINVLTVVTDNELTRPAWLQVLV